jgi:subtilisin family serine protease
MQHKRVWFAGAVLLLVLASVSPAFAADGPVAPLLSAKAPDAIAGRYIVVFKDAAAPAAVDTAMARAMKETAAAPPAIVPEVAGMEGVEMTYRYDAALKGFAAPLSQSAVDALRHNPNVLYIEVDSLITLDATQTGATWGIDRIDQRALPLSGSYTYNYTGAGVTAYIIDTGILTTHNEFGGRASDGYDAVDGSLPAADCNGHGTHVAGTVGGATYGVAKGVSLVAVRVLNCSGSGTNSGVIAGIDWVTAHHTSSAVANMSLGGGISTSLDSAVNNSINGGVTYAIAAGNSSASACNYSPARVAAAITVGATTSTDARASYSNYGTCLDIFAPGSSITSAWYTSTTATNTISGTSMATPHVAGAAALYLQSNPGASPATVASTLTTNATPNVVTGAGTGSPNKLLYSLTGGGPPPNVAPVASFTYSCTGLTCNFTDTSTDSDGTIAGWSWLFSDGGTSTEQNPSHTYGAGGTYTVQLTVTDDEGATGTTSKSVTVSSGSTSITLTATRRTSGRYTYADLAWSGATGANVDIYRNNSKYVTTANDGAYSDRLRTRGTYTYKVCNVGTSICSDTASVTY